VIVFTTDSPISTIPDPSTVRLHLSRNARERLLLEGLLRLAERKQREEERERLQRSQVREETAA
jgi:hypothetical protein